MVCGIICASAHGAALPLLLLVFGDMTDMFIDNANTNKFSELINWNLTSYTPEEAFSDQSKLR